MQCPKCQHPAEDFQTSAGVTVNFCQGCKGLWFDEGEFARYCQTASDLAHLTSRLQEAHPTSFTCPRCVHSLLCELPYQQGGALLIDWCPTCHGVWLDAGELQKIQRLALDETARSTPPREPALINQPLIYVAGCPMHAQQIVGLMGVVILLLGVALRFAMPWGLRWRADVVPSTAHVVEALLSGYVYTVMAGLAMVCTLKKAYRYLRIIGYAAWIPLLIYMVCQVFFDFLVPQRRAGSMMKSYQLVLFGCWFVGGAFIRAAGQDESTTRWTKVKSFGRIGGREVHVTLRDESEERMLKQLTPLFAILEMQNRRSQANLPADWCPIHHCRMSPREQDGQRSSAHRLDTGQWCQGA